MKINLKNKVIGSYRLKSCFFLHIYNRDTEINKSYVIDFKIEKEVKSFVSYDYGYKMLNLGLFKVGYSIADFSELN